MAASPLDVPSDLSQRSLGRHPYIYGFVTVRWGGGRPSFRRKPGSIFRRHSGEGRNPFSAVIPAKAGIHFDFVFEAHAKTDSRPCVFSSAVLAAESLSLLAQRK
jgi:hypothetical protein